MKYKQNIPGCNIASGVSALSVLLEIAATKYSTETWDNWYLVGDLGLFSNKWGTSCSLLFNFTITSCNFWPVL